MVLHLPTHLDVAGLLDLLLQVFALSKAAVLRRLRQRLQQVLTQLGDVALALWQHGPQAAWQAISAHAQDLRAQALDLVQQQVLAVAAQAVPLFLASLAVPGGAFLQLARGLYNGVMLFVEKGKQLAQVGQALFASASAIAAGQLAPAAQTVENTLVKILPVALAFLARQLGLDGISGAIQTGLKKVRVPVEKAVDKVLDTVADKAKAIWGALKTGVGKAVNKGKEVATAVGTKVTGWLGLRKPFTNQAGETHTLFFDGPAERPVLKVASTPTAIEVYLSKLAAGGALDDQQKAALTEAQLLAKELARAIIIRKPVPPALAETITTKIEQLSTLLAKLGGYDDPRDAPQPLAAVHTYAPENGALKTSRIEYLSTATSQGDSELSTLSPNGWHLIMKHRLTSFDRGHWVRLHLIGAKSGGQADVRNLVPAPHSVNAGAQVKSFEDAIKRLTESPPPPQNSVRPRAAIVQNTNRDDQKATVVWATASVRAYHPAGEAKDARGTVIETYGATDFVQRLIFKAGLHYFDAQAKTWKLDPQVRMAESVSVELPVFGTLRTSVNLDGRRLLTANLNCTAYFAQEIINERAAGKFRNIADLLSRMELRYEARQKGSTLRPDYVALVERVKAAENAGNF